MFSIKSLKNLARLLLLFCRMSVSSVRSGLLCQVMWKIATLYDLFFFYGKEETVLPSEYTYRCNVPVYQAI